LNTGTKQNVILRHRAIGKVIHQVLNDSK